MALRIGALILATCNLMSASFIDPRPSNIVVHHDDDDCDEHDGHKDHKGIHVEAVPVIKPVAASPLVIQDYVFGAGKKDYRDYSHSQKVNIDIPDVNFKPLKDQPAVSKDLKAPITIVTVPRVSTVETTKHHVSENYVKNESNLPEHKDRKNISAKKELLDYNNLLSTKVGPVKEVRVIKEEEESCDSDDDHHHHYLVPQVVPGNLEKKADVQIAVGKAIQNAPTVIRTYRVGGKTYYHQHQGYIHGQRKTYYLTHGVRKDGHRDNHEDDHEEADRKDDHRDEHEEDHREDRKYDHKDGRPNDKPKDNVKDPFNWLYALVGHK